jgi:hypothetical protein
MSMLEDGALLYIVGWMRTNISVKAVIHQSIIMVLEHWTHAIAVHSSSLTTSAGTIFWWQ